nr:hypothetical protein [Neobacillus sp. Marseille-Q6967]
MPMMEESGLFGLFAFIPILTILTYLFLLAFGIYFMVRTLKFMSEKTKLDQQRNDKLEALIKAVEANKSDM